jgi:hypothetical protein
VFASPDGSCLLCLCIEDSRLILHGYHCSDFGSANGVELTVPIDFGNMFAVTPLVEPSNVYFLEFDGASQYLQSLVLKITSQVTEYMFREWIGSCGTREPKNLAQRPS